MFQQFNCQSCGQMWHNAQNETSLAYVVSKQICLNPEDTYNYELLAAAGLLDSEGEAEVVMNLLKKRPVQLSIVVVEVFGILLAIFLIGYQCCCIRNRKKVGIAPTPTPDQTELKKGHTRNETEMALNSEATITGTGDASQRSNLGTVELPSILNVTGLDNTARLDGSNLEMMRMADQMF